MEQLINEDPDRIGPYRLIARLGAGGMGLVYLGRSEGGRTVAVKVVQAEHAQNPEFRRRFAREVAAARRVGGSWTADVLDADPEAAVPWVATRYVPGPDLHAVVERDFGPLPGHSVRILANRLALALQAVHGAGLIHRDLKPSNVLVTVDGPCVIDFGIVRAMDTLGPDSLHTHTGMLIGSPGFMSPEQVRGLELTPASDVFCLGAVLVYAATGRMLFGARDTGLNAHLFRVAEEEADLTGVPEGLADLVRACLDKDPARRPTPEQVVERTAAADGAEWLPGAVLAQLGRHAAGLLDFAPETRVAGTAAAAPAAPPDPRVPVRPPSPSPSSSSPSGPPVPPPPPAYAPAGPTPPAYSPPGQGFGPPPGALPDEAPGPAAAPPHPRRWWGLAVIALAQLMVLLDVTAFNLALPTVQADLAFPSEDLDPLFESYTFAFAALLVLGGHLADLVGRKALLISGLAGSAAASVVAGTAGTAGLLTAARIGQGAFAALLTASTLALLTASFPAGKERGTAFGVYAAVVGGGSVFGLLTGGWLLEALSWRVAAYATAVLAVVALAGTLALVHDGPRRPDRPAGPGGRFDPIGALLGTAGLVVLTCAFTAAQPDHWADPITLVLLVAGAALFTAYAAWRARTPRPLPGSADSPARARLGCFLALFPAGVGAAASFPPVVFFLQNFLGYPPVRAGTALLPMVAAVVTGSQASGRLAARVAPRVLIAVGLAAAAGGLLLLSGMAPGGAYAVQVLPGTVLYGLGTGVALAPLFATGTAGADPQRSGAVAAAVTAAQHAGGTFGAALFSSVLHAGMKDWMPESLKTDLLAGYTDTLLWAAGAMLLGALIAGLTVTATATTPVGATAGSGAGGRGPVTPGTADTAG
ncbi:MDR family MFS transporter [Streptomyces sp. NPDC089799]|uniref:MDR family MFS transporter n=1 Tax=Streptomyces sp. NPDC089799 TaxID=3155066 RepID=UPI00341F5413